MVRGRGGLSGIHRGDKKFGGLGLQIRTEGSSVSNIFKVHALKRYWDQERLSLNEGSSLKPTRKGIISIEQLQQSREKNTGLHLHPLKIIKKWRVN